MAEYKDVFDHTTLILWYENRWWLIHTLICRMCSVVHCCILDQFVEFLYCPTMMQHSFQIFGCDYRVSHVRVGSNPNSVSICLDSNGTHVKHIARNLITSSLSPFPLPSYCRVLRNKSCQFLERAQNNIPGQQPLRNLRLYTQQVLEELLR